MSVALLLITHNDIGKTIHNAAVSVIGSSPLRTQFLSVDINCKPDDMFLQAQQQVTMLDTGDGVLILTDMYGSTPSNIACAMQTLHVAVVTGLNLPMLIRVLNYPNLPLNQLATKAVSGGQDGVIFFHPVSNADVAQGN